MQLKLADEIDEADNTVLLRLTRREFVFLKSLMGQTTHSGGPVHQGMVNSLWNGFTQVGWGHLTQFTTGTIHFKPENEIELASYANN